jgi:hypothetical protein
LSVTLLWSNALGILGAALVMGAYALNQSGRLASGDVRFPAANLVGSVLILISLFFAFNLPSFVIEVIWIAISVYGVWRAARATRKARIAGSAQRPIARP